MPGVTGEQLRITHKNPCAAATDLNIADLAAGAPDLVDNVALSVADRILVKNQDTGSQNGIYVVDTVGTGANGAWSRALDFVNGVDNQIEEGLTTYVRGGIAFGGRTFRLATTGAITVGSTALAFSQVEDGTERTFVNDYKIFNFGYTSDAAMTTGHVFVYDPTSTTDTVNGVYTAGVGASSDPTVVTTGSGTFTAGDLVMLSGSTSNDGIYEVQGHTGTTLTFKSTPFGITNQQETWTRPIIFSGPSDGAALTHVNVRVVRVNTSGDLEMAKGNSAPTGLAYSTVSTSGALSILRVTGTGTITTQDVIIGDTDGGAFTYNLEATPADGRQVTLKNSGTSGNDLTVGRNLKTIDKVAADLVIPDLGSKTLIFEATEGWLII